MALFPEAGDDALDDALDVPCRGDRRINFPL
jgi:hypothetical protein